MSSRRRLVVAAAAVLALVLAAGLYWFQPWKLVIDHRVDEALPAVASDSPVADVTSAPAPASTPAASAPAAPVDVLLARGRLVSHEHHTSGTVSIVRRTDGSRVLALADLDTSDGPDVHVWLTDAPVLRGERGWHVFDDGRHVDLGSLKGNLGNQLYRIPPSLDLRGLTSVSIWCARFDVSFGAAELVPVAGA